MNASRQTAIGAFVFGGLVLALMTVVLFGNFRLFNPTTRAAIIFQGSISGLTVGAPVTFRGVRVGAVQNITLQFDQTAQAAFIPVTVQLDPDSVRVTGGESGSQRIDLQVMVQRGLRAELLTQSFVTGQAQIDLDFDPGSQAVLHPSLTKLPEIPTRLSAFQRVQEQLTKLPIGDLVKNADATLTSLHGLLDRLNQQMPVLFDDAKTISAGVNKTLDTATSAIGDLQKRIDETLGHIDRLVVDSDQQVTQRGADLHTLLTTSTQTMMQLRESLGDLRSLTSSRGQARTNLEATLRDVAAAAASLRGFANDVEHNPQLLLTGRRP
jgi:phospholipid/cholesterol/gamma-HCH transport system substrate-binding protein